MRPKYYLLIMFFISLLSCTSTKTYMIDGLDEMNTVTLNILNDGIQISKFDGEKVNWKNTSHLAFNSRQVKFPEGDHIIEFFYNDGFSRSGSMEIRQIFEGNKSYDFIGSIVGGQIKCRIVMKK